jgi:hypothetical protein
MNHAVSQDKCNQPSGTWVADDTDCDDYDEYVYPGGPEIRLAPAPYSYYNIDELQSAYNDAGSDDTIQSKVAIYTGPFSVDDNKSINFENGYSCDYISNIGVTTINGDMTISNGTVTIQSGALEIK